MKGWIAVTVHASGLEGWCNVSRITFVGPYRDSDGIKGSWVTVNGNDFLVNESGRLRVSAKPAIRNTDGAEIIQLVLTARGAPAGSQTEDVMQWIDEGREWVVRGFADFTTPEMHKLWKRTQ